MNRNEIQEKINGNAETIKKLQLENLKLYRESLLLSDDVQQYKEEIEEKGRGKNKTKMLVGRIYWKEDFKNEDNDEFITVERNEVVRINGEWQ